MLRGHFDVNERLLEAQSPIDGAVKGTLRREAANEL